MRHRLIIGVLFIVLVRMFSPNLYAADDDIVLIAHASVARSLKKEEVKDIYLGEKTRWDDATKIDFVVLKDKKPYKDFLKHYVKKTSSQYNSYWKMKVFNGTGRMPTSFKNSADVIEYVANTEGAIGFVVLKDVDETMVEIILVD